MASLAQLVGGALMNALAFSGSYWLLSMLKNSGHDEERKRHDKAAEQLQAAQAEWSVAPTYLWATTGQLSACWRLIGMLEYLADLDGASLKAVRLPCKHLLQSPWE